MGMSLSVVTAEQLCSTCKSSAGTNFFQCSWILDWKIVPFCIILDSQLLYHRTSCPVKNNAKPNRVPHAYLIPFITAVDRVDAKSTHDSDSGQHSTGRDARFLSSLMQIADETGELSAINASMRTPDEVASIDRVGLAGRHSGGWRPSSFNLGCRGRYRVPY